MRIRLFWKILIGSWLTLILFAIGNALVFNAASTAVVPWGVEAVQRFERLQLSAAARILQSHGRDALAAFASGMPEGERLEVLEGEQPMKKQSARDIGVSEVVHAPSGTYTLVYRSSGELLFPPLPSVLLRVPAQLLLVYLVAVSIFSILIARFLAEPIQRLRAGLARVAEGDLTVRVSERLGRRRDELADLARDFDRMAERLQLLLASRERLLHDVSHEFRSPLTRLLLAVDLVRQNPDRSPASLERIEYEAKRLNDLVGELLTLSRVEFSAAKSETWFAITDLVAIVAADASFEAEAKGVVVKTQMQETSHDDTGPIINGSPELMRKGIENVLRNAVKVSRPGQTVTVRLLPPAAPGDKLRIEVSDEGPGVPDEALERIFEPFLRLEGQPQGSGFGLGLAIARSAANAHNGTVWAANRPAGGLTLTFELPVQTSAPVPGAGAADPSAL